MIFLVINQSGISFNVARESSAALFHSFSYRFIRAICCEKESFFEFYIDQKENEIQIQIHILWSYSIQEQILL